MANFDFKAYNEMVRNAPAGLKLALAENLLKDVVFAAHMWKNPLEKDLQDVYDELQSTREAWKKAAALRQQNDSSESTAKVDNQFVKAA